MTGEEGEDEGVRDDPRGLYTSVNCGKEGFDVGASGALVVVGLPEIEDAVRDIQFGEALISI